jgi:hypothetical protein
MNEFHDTNSLDNTRYNRIQNESVQGYVKPQFEDYENRKIDKDLTPKEKKLLEQYPKMELDKIKNLKQKNSDEKINTRSNTGMSLDFSGLNNTVYNKVVSNNSNIFNNRVNYLTNKFLLLFRKKNSKSAIL